ncbi:MAG: tellurite resistance/C4-dicarboxylate transporter family protein [Betaproteobacteria bacterium]|nr:tellurite resistance/C4-dicarboxylate transporter family protein [Betaproteobacteria bacterium]
MAIAERQQPRLEPERRAAISASSRLDPVQLAIANLSPAYFAMVMATGIVGIACRLERISALPEILLAINLVAYVTLWTLTLLRTRYHPRRFFDDFASHQRGPGFFTAVAATSVLGVELVLELGLEGVAYSLWWFALALWMILTYGIFTALTVRENKPALDEGINGAWLTAVVATQSLVVLGCLAMPRVGADSEGAMFALVLLWLAGGMLYIWMISLIFYRYTFFRFHPQDLTPPYWINMGAMAISALAGVLLIGIADASPLLSSLLPFLKGFTLLFWATATWWIPMLVILGVWRHVHHKVPLTYDPLYWGAVFPLGMYAAATFRLAEVFSLPFLFALTPLFLGLALTTWLMTFLGLILTLAFGLRRVLKNVRPRPHVQPLIPY